MKFLWTWLEYLMDWMRELATVPRRWRELRAKTRMHESLWAEFNDYAAKFGYVGRNGMEVAVEICRRCAGAEEGLRRVSEALQRELDAAEVPGLGAAEIERLAMLAEECGEVTQAVGKILRHGWQSSSPFGGPTNKVSLEREMGDVRAVIDMMIAAGDVRAGDIQHYRAHKRANAGRWLHHQIVPVTGAAPNAAEEKK